LQRDKAYKILQLYELYLNLSLFYRYFENCLLKKFLLQGFQGFAEFKNFKTCS